MKFLADMGISQSTVHWLRDQGYDAVHLREQQLHRLPDPEIVKKANIEGRIILTCDLDFGALMAFSGEQHPSIVIFRLGDETPQNVNQRLSEVLNKSASALNKGAIILIEQNRYRIRLLPI